MHTEVRKIDLSYHVLEVSATSTDLEEDVKREVRKLKRAVHLKGFRPGHVPHTMVKRLYRSELKDAVTENFLREVFTDMVVESGQYDLPADQYFTESLEYEVDEDLKAELAFNVLPEIDLELLKQAPLPALMPKTECTEADVDRSLKQKWGEYESLEAGEQTDEFDRITCTIHEVDEETRRVIIGGFSEEFTMHPADGDMLDEPYRTLSEELPGWDVGGTLYFSAPIKTQTVIVEAPSEMNFYSATIIKAQRLKLPDWDDEMIGSLSEGEYHSEAELRTAVAASIQRSRNEERRQYNMMVITDHVCSRLPFQLPESRLEMLRKQDSWSDDMVNIVLKWPLVCAAIHKQLDTEAAENSKEETDEEPAYSSVDIRVLDFLYDILTPSVPETESPEE